MRRPTIATVASMCLATLVLTVAFAGSAAFGAGSAGRAIPSAFRAQSLSWVTPTRGWMLGAAPCASSSTSSTCTTVIGTTDGGGTWKALGTINAPLMLETDAGVTEIRFADDLHGWAFGPALWATGDGGATWKRHRPPGAGRRVLALAGDVDAVYSVVSPCRINHVCHDPATLWRTTAGSGAWTQVPVTLPASTDAALAVRGLIAYAVVQSGELDPDVLEVTVDGQTWSSRPDPCVKTDNEFLTDVAPVSDTKVALLCVANIGFSQAEKRVLRSNDTGQTTSSTGSIPRDGITSWLAAAPNGTLTVTSWGAAGSWIYRNASGKTWTTPVSLNDLGQGWNDVVFTTNTVGFVVHGPAAVYPGNRPGELWSTTDGGLTWAPV
jgi:photosystem II stability/assembly factor-like uncharacterized protein